MLIQVKENAENDIKQIKEHMKVQASKFQTQNFYNKTYTDLKPHLIKETSQFSEVMKVMDKETNALREESRILRRKLADLQISYDKLEQNHKKLLSDKNKIMGKSHIKLPLGKMNSYMGYSQYAKTTEHNDSKKNLLWNESIYNINIELIRKLTSRNEHAENGTPSNSMFKSIILSTPNTKKVIYEEFS